MRKSILIIGVLFVLLFSGCVDTPTPISPSEPDPCNEFKSWQDCNSHSECKAVYGPSSCNDDLPYPTCTTDEVFQSCITKVSLPVQIDEPVENPTEPIEPPINGDSELNNCTDKSKIISGLVNVNFSSTLDTQKEKELVESLGYNFAEGSFEHRCDHCGIIAVPEGKEVEARETFRNHELIEFAYFNYQMPDIQKLSKDHWGAPIQQGVVLVNIEGSMTEEEICKLLAQYDYAILYYLHMYPTSVVVSLEVPAGKEELAVAILQQDSNIHMAMVNSMISAHNDVVN